MPYNRAAGCIEPIDRRWLREVGCPAPDRRLASPTSEARRPFSDSPIVTSAPGRSLAEKGSSMRSWCRRALVGAFVLLLLWPPGTPSADAQRLPSAAPQPNGAQQASITGTLLIKYGDPQPGTRRADREEISIRDDAGQRVAVTVSDATRIGEALHGLNGKRVTISGAGAMRAA